VRVSGDFLAHLQACACRLHSAFTQSRDSCRPG